MNSTPVSWKPIRPARLSFFLVARPISTGRNPASTSRKSPRWGRLDWNTSARKTIRETATRKTCLQDLNFRETDSISERRTSGNKRKSLGAGLERPRLALERWQGLYRRGLLSQRAYGSGSRPDERGLRNHFRQPKRQRASSGCAFRGRRFLRGRRGQASGLYVIPRRSDWAQRSSSYLGCHRIGSGSV